jgi:hypothetical protein
MWDWFARILGAMPREERDGATLSPGPCWRVSAPADSAEFVRRLCDLLPPASTLGLEGGSPDAAIEEFLHRRACEPRLKLALGTIWPRPRVFHIPASAENLAELAALFESHAAPEICIHFHAYCDQQVVLQWHDAFFNDPLLLSLAIPEPRVKAFCDACACPYSLDSAGP